MFGFSLNDMKTRAILALAVLFVGTAAFAVSFYREASDLRANPQQIVEEEVGEVVAKVSRHMVLPDGEIPTVATVSDPEALSNQPFFSKAQIGDRVLIYASALKAILYSPELDRIIEIAPLNIGNPPQ